MYVNSEGKFGAQVSSRRFKDEIKAMERISEIIYGLKPVSFRYKPEIEPTRLLGFGLIAEEVEKISSDVVTSDSNGQANAVRYDAVNAMLLNEFLKEHHRVEEQKSAMTDQRKEFEAVVARLNEQEAQIQKVSAKTEVGKPASQMLVENR